MRTVWLSMHVGGSTARQVLKRPVSVALLNLGQEEAKRLPEVKAAAQRLKSSSDFQYLGFVEPAGLFSGAADGWCARGYWAIWF